MFVCEFDWNVFQYEFRSASTLSIFVASNDGQHFVIKIIYGHFFDATGSRMNDDCTKKKPFYSIEFPLPIQKCIISDWLEVKSQNIDGLFIFRKKNDNDKSIQVDLMELNNFDCMLLCCILLIREHK